MIAMKKLFVVLVAVLMGVTMNMPAQAGVVGVIKPGDGSSEEAYALLYTWNHRLLFQNWGEQAVKVSYSDATYGSQTVWVAPHEPGSPAVPP